MVQSSHGMLTQHITGQGQIGFEFADAGLIDQGRQRVVRRQYAVCSGLEVTANSLVHTANKKS